MDRKVTIGGQECTLRCNALLPRKYRHMFGRDLISDMNKLVKEYKKTGEFNSEVFEDLTWLMLREGGNSVGSSSEEWLQTVDDIIELYSLFPIVVELWSAGTQTTSKPKKK